VADLRPSSDPVLAHARLAAYLRQASLVELVEKVELRLGRSWCQQKSNLVFEVLVDVIMSWAWEVLRPLR
jgi:hypothetical protein